MADAPERQTKLTLDLKEQVQLLRLVSTEALSQHFSIILDLLAPLGEIDFLPHLGKPAAVNVLEDEQHQRYFHGLVTGAEFVGEIEARGFHYRIELKPAAYLHAHGRNFRIFQDKTTKDIIETVLKDCGIRADFTQMSGSTPSRPYCVQYGESNFGFVSRLMEEEGLYYYYSHEEDSHIMTICDGPSSHKEGEASPLVFNENSAFIGNVDSAVRFDSGHKQFVHSWYERVSTGGEQKVTLRDFDFMKPGKPLEVESVAEAQHGNDALEFYAYPARTYASEVGRQRSDILLESQRANRRTYRGSSVNAAISCGKTFKLKEHAISRFNTAYLVTATSHQIASEHYSSTLGLASGTIVDIEAVPAETTWRAPLTTRRPTVQGPETAWVTGPTSEEIYTDKYGRVKVQFHWDREGKLDENSSCWIRVSQTGGLGNIILPRVGHEVLVDFIDGDPDRPIVVGRVFNENHMPIYPLPDHKTRALWRTKTYKEKKPSGAKMSLDTGDPGVNEVRFEDKPGNEEIFIHAQRNMNTRVQRDETHHLGNDLEIKVGQNRSMTIGLNDKVKVTDNRDTKIGKNETREIGQKLTIKAGTEIEISAGAKITLKVGASSITMDGSSIEIKTVTLKTEGMVMAEHKGGGANKAVLDPSGVTINGVLVRIN